MIPLGRINPCGRSTVGSCPCADCRHGRFNPGPPTKPRPFFYGNRPMSRARKRFAERLREWVRPTS